MRLYPFHMKTRGVIVIETHKNIIYFIYEGDDCEFKLRFLKDEFKEFVELLNNVVKEVET